MNYLAHIYLSGEDEKVVVGNFIGDYIKGKKYNKFPEEIAKGILLHRQIDSFTDKHKKVSEAKELFRDDYGLYAGIVIDFFYDHFLAKNWNQYSELTLRSFAKKTHAVLLSNFKYLPIRVKGFLPFLIQNKRLESYASIDGIIESLEIMSNYSSLPKQSESAKQVLIANYDFLNSNFESFMSDIIDFVCKEQGIKIKKPGKKTGLS